MGTAVILILLGIGSLAFGGNVTRQRVTARFGQVDEMTMEAAQGNGTVPSWVSLVVLGGWAALCSGVIAAIASLT